MKKEDFELIYKDAKEKGIQDAIVIQLSPENTANPMFKGCFAVVSEFMPLGVLCYVQGLGKNGESVGQAYYRAVWETFMYTGIAEWVVG